MPKRRKHGIVMPTRSRFNRLEVCLPHWLEQDMPIHLIVEPGEVRAHWRWLCEHDFCGAVNVVSQKKSNAGIGYARRVAMTYAHEQGYTECIMADDDVHPFKGESVKPLLDFVAKENAMGIAGWMSSYGLWFPNGNETAKQPGLAVPVTGIGDCITGFNVKRVLAAGNFNPDLDVLHENGEIIRQSYRTGYCWWVSTDVHIKMLGKRNDPGGIVAQAGSLEARLARETRCHAVVHALWPDYVSAPPKRYSCRWRRLITDYVGEEAREAVYSKRVFDASDIPRYMRRKA